jgi:hypothetical protein
MTRRFHRCDRIPFEQSVRKFSGNKLGGLEFYFLAECAGMRPFLFIIVLTVCLAAPASAFQQPTNPWDTIPRPPHAVSAPDDSQAERQLLDLANRPRAEAGLAPLQSHEALTRAARKHSELMASR